MVKTHIGWAIKNIDLYLCIDNGIVAMGIPSEKIIFTNRAHAYDQLQLMLSADSWKHFDDLKVVRIKRRKDCWC